MPKNTGLLKHHQDIHAINWTATTTAARITYFSLKTTFQSASENQTSLLPPATYSKNKRHKERVSSHVHIWFAFRPGCKWPITQIKLSLNLGRSLGVSTLGFHCDCLDTHLKYYVWFTFQRFSFSWSEVQISHQGLKKLLIGSDLKLRLWTWVWWLLLCQFYGLRQFQLGHWVPRSLVKHNPGCICECVSDAINIWIGKLSEADGLS